MEILVIIVNNNKVRKKIKEYLNDIGLGDFIVVQSVGSTVFQQYYTNYKPALESAYQGISTVPNNSQTILSIIKDTDKTEEILDHIAMVIQEGPKKRNTGVAFTIPFEGLFKPEVK
jgi:nitrogen regulatory protein PII